MDGVLVDRQKRILGACNDLNQPSRGRPCSCTPADCNPPEPANLRCCRGLQRATRSPAGRVFQGQL